MDPTIPFTAGRLLALERHAGCRLPVLETPRGTKTFVGQLGPHADSGTRLFTVFDVITEHALISGHPPFS